MGRVIVARGLWSRRRVLSLAAAGAAGAAGVAGLEAAAGRAGPGAAREADPVLQPTAAPRAARTTAQTRTLPYTARARRVLEEAQKEAFARGYPAYGQEELLLGIAVVPESAGLEVLSRLGVTQKRLRAEVDATLESAAGASALHQPHVSVNTSWIVVRPGPTAQTTLALAADEAVHLGHNWLGVEHLLLAMLREPYGPGDVVLQRLGVRLGVARAALLAFLERR